VQEEESLVRRAQQRDEEAFARIYEEYFDKIYRFVTFRIGDQTEAEDVTQQVFIKVLHSISSFKWKGIPFSAWLFRIARNQVIDYVRKKKRYATVPLDERVADSDIDPQSATERKLDIERVLAATKQLTDSQREVISLRFTSELSVAEVARIMGKSEGAVKALQHSAIAALRKVLSVA